MGGLFDDDDEEEFDLAAIEARHEQIELELEELTGMDSGPFPEDEEPEDVELENEAPGTGGWNEEEPGDREAGEPDDGESSESGWISGIGRAWDAGEGPEGDSGWDAGGGPKRDSGWDSGDFEDAADGGVFGSEGAENAGDISGEASGEAGYPASDWEAIIEAVLFTMGHSVELRQLAVAIGQDEKMARRVVESLRLRYEQENRGMQILELDGSYQMCTRAKFYENLIRVASAPKKQVLTEVVLETLSIIAYKQPVTKMEISRIRGVSSDHAVNRLIEYGLVYEVGRLDAPGRPALFATTEEFLRRFGVGSVTDLPGIDPEQEEEIIQEVQEELQVQLDENGALPEEAVSEAAEESDEIQEEEKTDAED